MANSATVDALVDAARANGSTNPYAFVVGILGSMADEQQVLDMIEWLKGKAN